MTAKPQVKKTKAKKTVVVHAANFSIGINLLIGLIEKATPVLIPNYDIEILEIYMKLVILQKFSFLYIVI